MPRIINMKHLFLTAILCILPLTARAETIKNIPYIAGSTLKKQQLDIYIPEKEVKNAPVHIFVHGGGWNIGDKKTVKAKEAKAYTNQSIILVTLNYRLSPGVQHPAHVQDIAAGISWVHKNISKYGGNPKNIVLSGHSAGGHLVTLIGTDAQYLKKHGLRLNMFKAIIPIDHSKYDLTTEHKGPLSRLVTKWTKNAFGTDKSDLRKASPIYQDLTQTLSPFLITVTSERQHAKEQSTRFTNALKQNDQKVSLLIIDGLTHNQMKRTLFEHNSEMFNYVISYLRD